MGSVNPNLWQSQRVAVLVDVHNLYFSGRNQFQARVAFDKLLDGICDGRLLSRAIAYVVQRPDVRQDNFIDALANFGYEVRVKDSKMRPSDKAQADSKPVPVRTSWEVGMTLDAVSLMDKVDVVVIASGDSCYVPLAQYLKTNGCRVEIAAFEDSTSNELIKTADDFIPIEKEWTMPEKSQASHSQPQQPVLVDNQEDDEAQPVSNESRLGIFGSKKK